MGGRRRPDADKNRRLNSKSARICRSAERVIMSFLRLTAYAEILFAG